MNLLYVAGVVAGNGVTVALVALAFGRTRSQLGSCAEIVNTLERRIYRFSAGEWALDTSGRAAIVEDIANHSLLLVTAVADHLAVRTLSPTLLKGIARDGSRVSLRLKDFAMPRADIVLNDEAEALEWERRLKER